MYSLIKTVFLTLIIACIAPGLHASKLITVNVLDRDFLIIHFKDGNVKFVDDGTGPTVFAGHESDPENSYVVTYGEPLNLDALLLEADWGLGRNPLNKIQMTTATTDLADKRSFENIYTSGRDDGTPGLHPGYTPYLNARSWGSGDMVGANPGIVFDRFYYPKIENWPHAEKYINTRFIWSHSEFTPRQTMRGKALLYAYLYGLYKNNKL